MICCKECGVFLDAGNFLEPGYYALCERCAAAKDDREERGQPVDVSVEPDLGGES